MMLSSEHHSEAESSSEEDYVVNDIHDGCNGNPNTTQDTNLLNNTKFKLLDFAEVEKEIDKMVNKDLQESIIAKKQQPKNKELPKFTKKDTQILDYVRQYLQDIYLKEKQNKIDVQLNIQKLDNWLTELIKSLTRRTVAVPLTNVQYSIEIAVKMQNKITNTMEDKDGLNAQIIWFFISALKHHDLI